MKAPGSRDSQTSCKPHFVLRKLTRSSCRLVLPFSTLSPYFRIPHLAAFIQHSSTSFTPHHERTQENGQAYIDIMCIVDQTLTTRLVSGGPAGEEDRVHHRKPSFSSSIRSEAVVSSPRNSLQTPILDTPTPTPGAIIAQARKTSFSRLGDREYFRVSFFSRARAAGSSCRQGEPRLALADRDRSTSLSILLHSFQSAALDRWRHSTLTSFAPFPLNFYIQGRRVNLGILFRGRKPLCATISRVQIHQQ